MMSRLKKGLIAGFAAVVAVSLLEAVNLLAGPWFDPFPGLVAVLMGMPGNLVAGWVAHIVVGTVLLGGVFGIVCPRLPTSTPETKGIVFAVGAFVLMMLAVFSVGGAGTFSSNADFGNVAWMLVTHAVFGIVMGNVYGRLVERDKRLARDMSGAAPAH